MRVALSCVTLPLHHNHFNKITLHATWNLNQQTSYFTPKTPH